MKYKNTKVNLFGTIYKIKFTDSPIEDSNGSYWGMCYHERLEILVATKTSEGKGRPDDEIKITLLHELTHAVLAAGSYHAQCDDEPLVEWIARCIAQIMKQIKI